MTAVFTQTVPRSVDRFTRWTAIFSVTVFSLFTVISFGQRGEDYTLFNPKKLFVKGIYIVTKGDSLPNKTDTLYSDIDYIKETTKRWNWEKKKWETGTTLKTAVSTYFLWQNISTFDSIYFDEKYTIEKFTMSVTVNGGEWEVASKNNNIDDNIRNELKRMGEKCKCLVYFDLIVSNNKGQKQKLALKVHSPYLPDKK